MTFLQVFRYASVAGLLFSVAAKVNQACSSEKQDCSSSASSKALLQVGARREATENGTFAMCVVRDNTCFDLFMGPNWDDGVTSNQAPSLGWSDAQLVVARYDEDLRWLDALPQIPAIVYNRGDTDSLFLPKSRQNLQIVAQPNRGREDQVFLEHIVNHYDSLPEATVFLQGWPFGHCPGFLQAVRRALTYVLTPEAAGPNTAGFMEGLAPVTSTFWQYNTQNARLGLAVEMAEKNFPRELNHTAKTVLRDAYTRICQALLGDRPCPTLQWVAEGAQWAVSRKRIQSTPLQLYQSAVKFGEGWEGKFRGLVLEALWPVVFGAENWQPTQVDYMPLWSARANNRARSSDDYCELLTEATSGKYGPWGWSNHLSRRSSRHLLFSCSQRAEYCERQMRDGALTSQLWLAERQHYEIQDPNGFLPWRLKAQLLPVLFGASVWWPRNSPQGHRVSSIVEEGGYSLVVVDVDGLVQLPEKGQEEKAEKEWLVSKAKDGFTFSRINAQKEERFLGCENGEAKMLTKPVSWNLIQLLDGWVRLYNIQDGRFLSLDDRRDGAFLYCVEAIPDPEVSEQAAFFIDAMKKQVF